MHTENEISCENEILQKENEILCEIELSVKMKFL